MANVQLEKPGAITGAVIGGSLVGTGGTSFYIKVLEASFDHSSPAIETTGDGDTAPHFENNCLGYMQFSLRGAMVTSQAIGVDNLIASAKNPSASFVFNLGPNQSFTATVLIEGFRTQWSRRGQFVGVAMRGRATGGLGADVKPSEA